MEEIWVILSLVLASSPAFVRVAKQFTTTGVAFTAGYGTSKSGSRSKPLGYQLRSIGRSHISVSKKMGSITGGANGTVQNPDEGVNTVNVEGPSRGGGENGSIRSTAESHTGILKRIDFDVHYENK